MKCAPCNTLPPPPPPKPLVKAICFPNDVKQRTKCKKQEVIHNCNYILLQKPCEKFIDLLRDQAMLISSYITQTYYGDKDRAAITKKALDENAVKWGDVLGSTWIPILQRHIRALKEIIDLKLNRSGDNQQQLEDSIDDLNANRTAMVYFFKALPTLCGKHDITCLITSLWDKYTEITLSIADAYIDDTGDPEAVVESIDELSDEAVRFGQFLNDLNLQPPVVCANDEVYIEKKQEQQQKELQKEQQQEQGNVPNTLAEGSFDEDEEVISQLLGSTHISDSIGDPENKLEYKRTPKRDQYYKGVVPQNADINLTVKITAKSGGRYYKVLDLNVDNQSANLEYGPYNVAQENGDAVLVTFDVDDENLSFFAIEGAATLSIHAEVVGLKKEKIVIDGTATLTGAVEGNYLALVPGLGGYFSQFKVNEASLNSSRRDEDDPNVYTVNQFAVFIPELKLLTV